MARTVKDAHITMFVLVGHLFLSCILVDSVQIPFIDNATLEPGYISNSTLILNKTFDQCLCISSLSYVGLNCFSNRTCELFLTFPPVYRIKVTQGARLYFPQQLLPNTSQCCMPNINYLLNKLKLASLTSVNVPSPRDIVIDNYGYLATVEMKSNYLDRFDPKNLTRISQTTIQISSSRTIGYNNGAFFVASNNNSMIIINSENLTTLSYVTLRFVNGSRNIMFLDDGQTMVISSIGNNYLVFFNRTNVSPIEYTFAFYQLINYSSPHGLWRVNDSFFYATSYDSNSICSFGRFNSLWKESFVFSAPKVGNNTGVTHLTID